MESTVKLENVVASTTLAEDFDLEKMMESGLEGAEYNKTKFPGLVYRIENPKAAFLIFTSGKVVCTGAKSIENAHAAIITLANTLKDKGFDKIDPEPEAHVQNIVASADLKTTLNLNTIAIAFGLENVEYEPEVFPGLIYRVEAPKVVVLVFSSGKLVITGGKTPEDCNEGLRIVKTEFDNLGLIY
ncbi:MAG TPA: TATA-box-binding protein [Methanosarcina sp.]|nr:TATA-box-binding protein [Methanosarcina sp.]